MIDRIYDYMIRNRMIEEGGCILAAVSGGADSMCLLEILRELRTRAGFQLRVLHVHHGLRESAEGDLAYVAGYCANTGIPFEAVRVDAAGYAAEAGMSVEEAARHLRYEALESAAERWDYEKSQLSGSAECPNSENPLQSDCAEHWGSENSLQSSCAPCRIAVAHHLEDQAETVLFNLVRGSRLKGLRGMLPVNGRIIRPLLECSREEIEGYLRERGITWREDETNEDVRYARNLLRREVMPLLEKINAGAAQHIAKAAEEAAETEELLRAETVKALKECRELQEIQQTSIVLSIPRLLKELPLISRRVVYEVIAETAGRKKDLRDVHVQDVLKLAQKNGNGKLDVFAGVRVEKVYDKLIFFGTAQTAPEKNLSGTDRPISAASRRWPMYAGEYSCRVFDFDGNMASVSRKQYTKWFDYDKIGAFPSFRTREEGDRITLDESGRSKSIARYMIDAKIPAELRSRIVLPAAGREILWIPAGLTGSAETTRPSDSGRISASYMVSSRTRRILEINWEPAAGQPDSNRDIEQ
ncbi:MAG: tRNA lysidine(34) synthetase TilS [Lachnospiraceae bacterium]|nr:tRNA lysidine(34) synthetase TilS [Lachnospiraceae bacterium]